MNADVIIIGAGPVGLTLALDLTQRGVRVLVIEKNKEPLQLPKMERSNPRTMEIWRRLGLVEEIRAAGLPSHMPMNVLVVRNLLDAPLLRQEYPSVNEARQRIAETHDGSLPREPYQLVSQYALEPILMKALKQRPNAEIRQSTTFLGLEQDDHCVIASIRRSDGIAETVTAPFLVGCDGGGGIVRKEIGVGMQGRAGLGTVHNIFFRCDDFFEKAKVGFARHYCFAGLTAGGGAGGTIVVQGDMKHLAMHIMTEPPEDPAALLREVTGLDIHPQVLHCAPWNQHMLVAERHKVGRVFLAGDANHLYIPAGGLGMNTGIGDAVNLGWKLAAALQGWGGSGLLESYDTERRQAAKRNLSAATWAVEGVIGWRSACDPATLDGKDRSAIGRLLERVESGNRRVYEMHGADLGYRYASAVISDDEGPAPECPIDAFEPTTWPGAHLPHVWLRPGEAIYDRLRCDRYSILDLGGDTERLGALIAAFRAVGAPLDVLKIDDPQISAVYGRNYLLIRPDFHVVWRSDSLPVDPAALAAMATGNAPTMPSVARATLPSPSVSP
jgi:2-polyprenyl-6-methoxyphenol hydroxylase-like FAD-dependent oxidoreductase